MNFGNRGDTAMTVHDTRMERLPDFKSYHLK